MARAHTPNRRKKRLSREEKAEETRRALFRAAAKVVGDYGYADASISRITSEANIAQGTFYNYFETRQDLFDQLLPEVGGNMLDHIKEQVETSVSGVERELQRLTAYFDYLHENPEFYRILNEAEIFAPKAHEKHFQMLIAGYMSAFRRSRDRDELQNYSDEELEVIAYILLAARGYLSLGYAVRGGRSRKVPPQVYSAYEKIVSSGLFKF